jgi:hypothetical protein
MMDAMKSVDFDPLWSILDQKGTQTMLKQVLGEAGSLTDFETVQKRLQASWYSMDFQHGVKFDLTISTGDTFAAATLSSLMTAALTLRNERLGCREAGIECNQHRIRLRETVNPFCNDRCAIQQPAAISALPGHGALSGSYIQQKSGRFRAEIAHFSVKDKLKTIN